MDLLFIFFFSTGTAEYVQVFPSVCQSMGSRTRRYRLSYNHHRYRNLPSYIFIHFSSLWLYASYEPINHTSKYYCWWPSRKSHRFGSRLRMREAPSEMWCAIRFMNDLLRRQWMMILVVWEVDTVSTLFWFSFPDPIFSIQLQVGKSESTCAWQVSAKKVASWISRALTGLQNSISGLENLFILK